MPGEEARGCSIGRVAGQAPSDFLSQACSLPSYQALITDLDPTQLQPPPPLPPPRPLLKVPTVRPPLAQALSALLKPCLCPELGNCEPHIHGVHRTLASAVPLLGVCSWSLGIFSLSLAFSLVHTPGAQGPVLSAPMTLPRLWSALPWPFSETPGRVSPPDPSGFTTSVASRGWY